MVTSEHKTSV